MKLALTSITALILLASNSAIAGNFYCKTKAPLYPTPYGFGYILIKKSEGTSTDVRTSGALPYADYQMAITNSRFNFVAEDSERRITINKNTLTGIFEYINGGSFDLICEKNVRIGR